MANKGYAFHLETDLQREQMLSCIRETALRYRELSLTAKDKLLVLSTCAYDFNKDRSQAKMVYARKLTYM